MAQKDCFEQGRSAANPHATEEYLHFANHFTEILVADGFDQTAARNLGRDASVSVMHELHPTKGWGNMVPAPVAQHNWRDDAGAAIEANLDPSAFYMMLM